MGWPRSPPHYPGHQPQTSIDASTFDLDERDEGDAAFHAYPPTPVDIPQTLFQPSYVYDESEERRLLQIERRATRLRSCVCCGLGVFCTMFVLVCFGIVLSGSPTPRWQAMHLLHQIARSPMVQFTITPKPHTVLEKYGRRREEVTDFYGMTIVRGQLFPYTPLNHGSGRHLSFDGWIHVQTNTSASYDIVLSDQHGYRITRSVPLTHSRSRCVTADDIPPLHYLSAASDRAFHAQDWASFRMNCSRVTQAPVEIVFAHTPFVFCPEDVVTKAFSPIVNRTTTSTQSQTLWVHGERMLIELVLVNNKEEARHARSERTRLEALEMWGNATSILSEKCPYLEAPLASYSPRSSHVLDRLLGNVSTPRSAQGTDFPSDD